MTRILVYDRDGNCIDEIESPFADPWNHSTELSPDMASPFVVFVENITRAALEMARAMGEALAPIIQGITNFYNDLPEDVRRELERKERSRMMYYRRYERGGRKAKRKKHGNANRH